LSTGLAVVAGEPELSGEEETTVDSEDSGVRAGEAGTLAVDI